MKVLVVGAGLSGATVSRTIAEAGHDVVVLEEKSHVAGHCHTERDRDSGIMLHVYGPHIFHTDSSDVLAFVTQHAEFQPYKHRVTAYVNGDGYPLPITLQTLERFFGRKFSADSARKFVNLQSRSYGREPQNFEEKGRALIGDELFEALFDGYTRKQWGVTPDQLPASIFGRLPVRYSLDRNYFHHTHVAMPIGGYTKLTESILDHSRISLNLREKFVPGSSFRHFDHCVYTGALDDWFDHRFGRLPYRTLDFESQWCTGTVQDAPVYNYCDLGVPYTRTTEHKLLSPWEPSSRTVIYKEYSRVCEPNDTPFYPVNLAEGSVVKERYTAAAQKTSNVSFVGRLATFRYLDMDQAILEGLLTAHHILQCNRSGEIPHPFAHTLNAE